MDSGTREKGRLKKAKTILSGSLLRDIKHFLLTHCASPGTFKSSFKHRRTPNSSEWSERFINWESGSNAGWYYSSQLLHLSPNS